MAFRWILNNLILVFLIAVLAFGYMFRDDIGTRLAGIAEATGYNAVAEWLAPSASEEAPQPKAEAAAAAKPEPQPKPAPAPARSEADRTATQMPSQMLAQMPAQMMATMVRPAPMAPPCTGARPDVKTLAAWAAARGLYWSGDLAGAAEAYEQLIKDNPDIPDLPGELANIHFGQGRIDQAAGLYLEAGLRLLNGPEPGCAGRVIGILMPIDKEKADYLAKRMQTAGPGGQ
jgi:tetratricopeptide (TPR) repeat protein